MTVVSEQLLDAAMSGSRTAIREDFSPSAALEPERRPRRYTLISVDDHVVEPPDAFDGRLPRRFADRTPRVIETPAGAHAWLLDTTVQPQFAINAVAGQEKPETALEPTRYEDLRVGMWDIDARIRDMDVDGVYASLNFPSMVGFAGVRLAFLPDQELGLAIARAWNDWHLEGWAGPHPERIIPCQIPWLLDPEVAAAEVRRNAARGFHAMSFPELPHRVGLPSVHTDHWDPLWAACAETGTVICLHTGSSGLPEKSPGGPDGTFGVMFGAGHALYTAIDWLYSRIAIKFPDIKICLSEGGIGWVVALLDRLDHSAKYREMEGVWHGTPLTPPELLQRNFWFCALDDPSSLQLRHRIGIDRITLEVDYPHADSSWPDTQANIVSQIEGFPEDDIRRLTWQNASELFQHPVPEAVQRDPDAF